MIPSKDNLMAVYKNKAGNPEPVIALTPENLAWCAGLYEGEGCVVYPDSHKASFDLRISSTDLDVLESMVDRCGLGSISGPHPPNGFGKKPFYTWSARGRAAIALALLMRPWLGSRRVARLEEKIALWQRRPLSPDKLTGSDKIAALHMRDAGMTYKAIAEMFGVTLQVIYQICKSRTFREWVYVGGPMSGIDQANYPAFIEMTSRLRRAGFHVISPHELHPADETQSWEWYMRRDLRELIRCSRIVLLSGWESSRGATVEHRVAKDLGMDITYPRDIEALLERGPQWEGPLLEAVTR